MPTPASDRCPCGTGRPYDACCGRWHAGESAADAEALMRSRYTAFVRKNAAYLLATWHSRTRPERLEFDGRQQWLGLKVVAAMPTGEATAEVEFIARFRIGGASAARLHERSRFVREQGTWFYVDGELREPQG